MSDSLDKDSTFTNEIENNSSICSNCYRKLKTYSDPHQRMPDSLSDIVEYEDHVKREWVDDRHDSGRPSVKRIYCECGNIDDAKLRPLDNRQIMEIAQRIEEHLNEAGINFDRDQFYSFIKRHSKGSDIQFNEEKYFEKSIERSLIEDNE